MSDDQAIKQASPAGCASEPSTDFIHSPMPKRLAQLPRDVGWLLVIAGIIGEVAPGVFGTPFWVAGALVLNPKLGWRVESWLERRAPKKFNSGMRQIGRFLDDLERRYPRIRSELRTPRQSGQ